MKSYDMSNNVWNVQYEINNLEIHKKHHRAYLSLSVGTK